MSPWIPKTLLASIEASRPPRVLLVRHADRPPLHDGDSGHDVPLTPAGQARAAALGHRLAGSLAWAVSSPLLRCVETARRAGVEPKPSSLLGDPGPFVVDTHRAARLFERFGPRTVVSGQIDGNQWGCMRRLDDGARQVLSFLKSLAAQRGGTGLAVSHDAILIPIVAWVTGDRFEKRWIDYLDGAILTPDGLFWDGQLYEVRA